MTIDDLPEIEVGVPYPENQNRRWKVDTLVARMGRMQVGDSVFFAFGSSTYSQVNGRCQNARKHDRTKRFSVRTVDGGWRVWRVR